MQLLQVLFVNVSTFPKDTCMRGCMEEEMSVRVWNAFILATWMHMRSSHSSGLPCSTTAHFSTPSHAQSTNVPLPAAGNSTPGKVGHAYGVLGTCQDVRSETCITALKPKHVALNLPSPCQDFPHISPNSPSSGLLPNARNTTSPYRIASIQTLPPPLPPPPPPPHAASRNPLAPHLPPTPQQNQAAPHCGCPCLCRHPAVLRVLLLDGPQPRSRLQQASAPGGLRLHGGMAGTAVVKGGTPFATLWGGIRIHAMAQSNDNVGPACRGQPVQVMLAAFSVMNAQLVW